MSLFKKEEFLDFYKPVLKTRGGSKSNYHLSVTKGKDGGHLVFLTRLTKEFNSPERLSVKFAKEGVYFVFDVQTDKGIPFYVIGKSKSTVKQLGNNDLVKRLFDAFDLKDNLRAYFELFHHVDFDGMKLYRLEFMDGVELNNQLKL